MKSYHVLGLVIASLFLILATLKLSSCKQRGRFAQKIDSLYTPDEIVLKDLKANSFGRKADGLLQVRGNGALVLTKTKGLIFSQYVPENELQIPLEAIKTVSTTQSHLGKWVPWKLLKITFDFEGSTDAIAWWISDPQAWISAIESLKKE